jgi:hypothetical protein
VARDIFNDVKKILNFYHGFPKSKEKEAQPRGDVPLELTFRLVPACLARRNLRRRYVCFKCFVQSV